MKLLKAFNVFTFRPYIEAALEKPPAFDAETGLVSGSLQASIVEAGRIGYNPFGPGEDLMLALLDSLNDQLSFLPASDPAESSWSFMGFVPPLGAEGDSLVARLPGTNAFMLCVQKRERVVPGVAIRDLTEKRIKAFEEKEGREANKKDWAVIKDEVTGELLKRACIRPKNIHVMIDGAMVYVFAASAKLCEDVITTIRKALSSFKVETGLSDSYVLTEMMTKLLQHVNVYPYAGPEAALLSDQDLELCKNFRALRECRLENPTDGGLMAFKHEDPEGTPNAKVKEGYECIELCYEHTSNVVPVIVKMASTGAVKSFLRRSMSADDAADKEEVAEAESMATDYGSITAELWLHRIMLQKFWQDLVNVGAARPVPEAPEPVKVEDDEEL